jgi:hypothetical protein
MYFGIVISIVGGTPVPINRDFALVWGTEEWGDSQLNQLISVDPKFVFELAVTPLF